MSNYLRIIAKIFAKLQCGYANNANSYNNQKDGLVGVDNSGIILEGPGSKGPAELSEKGLAFESNTKIKPESIDIKKLKNIFGFTDETGKFLIVFENYEDLEPSELNHAIGYNGTVIPIKYLRFQNSNKKDNYRQTMYNFPNISGHIYEINSEDAIPDSTYYLVNDDDFNINAIVKSKKINLNDVDDEIIFKIENVKKAKVKKSWGLNQLDNGSKLYLIEFEMQNGNLLVSFSYITDDRIIFKDYPIKKDEISSWEITENGEVDPEMIDLLFAANSDEGIILGISLFSTEREHTFLMKENSNDFEDLNIESLRYIAPL